MNTAIIPARGGSKRIPRKNVRDFCGQPMIAWSIQAARASASFTDIIVSTDDPEIAEIARSCGAEVPFMRPAQLANDLAGTTPVIQHALAWLDTHGMRRERACCLYATAPFVRAEDIREALVLLDGSPEVDYVFTCVGFASPPQRALTYSSNGGVTMFNPQYELTRSQDLAPAFHDAGQFYWGRWNAWAEGRAIYSTRSRPFLLPRWRAQDIDTPDDWDHAERLFRNHMGARA